MPQQFIIPRGMLVSDAMPGDYLGMVVRARYYNGGGAEITPTAAATVTASFDGVSQVVPVYASREWRFNGPVTGLSVDLTGTGAATAEFRIWRTGATVEIAPPDAWRGFRALTTQPYTEANVKNGVQFYLRAAWPLTDTIPNTAGSNVRYIWFKTGAKPVLVKLREMFYVAEELSVQLYTGPTGVTGGTALAVGNYNGVAPVATTAQAKKNVSVTARGTEFGGSDPEYLFGAAGNPQRAPNSIPVGRERVLPANTEFLVAITNTGTSAARVQYYLDWYEGATDLPIGP